MGGYPARGYLGEGGTLWGGTWGRGVPCGGYLGGTLWGGTLLGRGTLGVPYWGGTLPGGTWGGYPAGGYPVEGVPCWGDILVGGRGGTGYPAGGVLPLWCKLQLSSSAVSWPYIALCPMELWVMLQSIMGVKKKKKSYGMGTPPPCGQTDTCQNITFPSYYVRGR